MGGETGNARWEQSMRRVTCNWHKYGNIVPLCRTGGETPPLLGAVAALVVLAGAAFPVEIELTPRQLYEGLEARKVIVEGAGDRLALDPRAFQF